MDKKGEKLFGGPRMDIGGFKLGSFWRYATFCATRTMTQGVVVIFLLVVILVFGCVLALVDNKLA